MRILFVTQAEKTHMLSMVPLAWALRSAGHDVRVASQPELRDAVAETGLPFCDVGPGYVLDQYLRAFKVLNDQYADDAGGGLGGAADLDRMDSEELLDVYRGTVNYWLRMVNEPMLDGLVEFCRRWRPDLVVWEPKTYAGGIAAKASGAAHVRFLWGMDVLSTMRVEIARRSADLDTAWREDALARWLGGCARRFGVEFAEELVHGQVTIDPYPEGLPLRPGPEALHQPIRYLPFNGSARVPAWLRARPERPRVCVTLGTTSAERFDRRHRLGDLLSAMAELDIEVVATLSAHQRQDMGEIPENIRVLDHVPMHPLLEGCAAVVHHGGAGTCLTAMSLGVPQLILSDLVLAKYQFDERVLAKRLADQGAGIDLTGDDVTPAGTRDALRSLLTDPLFSHRADLLRRRMVEAPTPAALVPRLERLATEHAGVEGPIPA